jgi:release factor glutamine methyltransferase
MKVGAPSARTVVREAAARLERAGVPEPAASAEVLLSELLGIGRGEIPLHEEPLTAEQTELYGTWISRRETREPVQRILGHAYFRNLKLTLSPETLIPRPDTESVVDAALQKIDRRGGSARVLDIGTGSGAIALSIAQERSACEVHATDNSPEALETARRNAHAASVNVHFHLADLVSRLPERFEVLVSNPPYIPRREIPHLTPEVRDWDPTAALDGGPDGLDFYRRIFREAPPLPAPGADVVLEVGDGQAGPVLDLGREAGFIPLGIHPDLAGTPRAVLLRWGR